MLSERCKDALEEEKRRPRSVIMAQEKRCKATSHSEYDDPLDQTPLKNYATSMFLADHKKEGP